MLKTKVTLLLTIVLVCMGLASSLTILFFIGNTFDNLDKENALSDLARVENVLNTKLDYLDAIQFEYAEWNEAYDFMKQNGDSRFVSEYMQESLSEYDMNFFAYFVGGEIRYGIAINLETDELTNLDRYFSFEHPEWQNELSQIIEFSYGRGVVPFGGQAILYSSGPVTRNDGSGGDVGHLAIGRIIDDSFIEEMEQLASAKVEFNPLTRTSSSTSSDSLGTHNSPLLTEQDNTITTSRILVDQRDQPVAQISSVTPKDVSAAGKRVLQVTVLTLMLILIVGVLLVERWLARNVTTPVNQLSHDLDQRKFARLNESSMLLRNDELGALCRQFVNLIDEKEKVANDLREALAEAKAVEEVKSDFLATVSHEIRTPMNGIIGLAELLGNTELDKKQKEFADTIKSSGDALVAMVNDILDFSKIDAGRLALDIDTFSIRELIEDVVTLFSVSADSKNIKIVSEFDGELPPLLLGDAGKIRQCLLNIVGNAIKYTEKGAVTVYVTGNCSDEYCALKIEVADTGIGIDERYTNSIFEKYTRISGDNTSHGTGLGLYITNRLVAMMGGNIAVSSRLGRGSRFFISLELPVVQTASDIPKPPVANSHIVDDGAIIVSEFDNQYIDDNNLEGEGRNDERIGDVLVVEDDVANQKLMQHWSANMKHDFIFVSDGAEALTEFKKNSYALVLMDIELPKINGIEAAKLIRRYEQQSNKSPVPIIGITGHVQFDQDRFADAGMNVCLEKPACKDTFREIINEWVGH